MLRNTLGMPGMLSLIISGSIRRRARKINMCKLLHTVRPTKRIGLGCTAPKLLDARAQQQKAQAKNDGLHNRQSLNLSEREVYGVFQGRRKLHT